MAVADNVTLGKGVKIFHLDLVNLYGCIIGDQTTIGPFIEIQSGVEIGTRCKLSSHSFICDGVTIDDEVFIGQMIALSDNTGISTGDHLHMELKPVKIRFKNDKPSGYENILRNHNGSGFFFCSISNALISLSIASAASRPAFPIASVCSLV